MEGLQVFYALAHTNKVDRKRSVATHCRNGGKHTSLRGTVEFRNDETRQVSEGVKRLNLRECILAVSAIYNKDYLVRGALQGFFLRATNATKLFHQIGLCWQTTCCVSNDHIEVARAASRNGIKDNRSRVAARLCDHVDAVTLSPNSQLFAGCSTERVACGEKNALTFICEVAREFADRGGLTRPIDAAHHDDAGRILRNVERTFGRLENFDEFIAQSSTNIILCLQALALNVATQALYDAHRGLNAYIGGDQRGLEFLQKVLINNATREDADDVVTCPRETFFQTRAKILKETKTHTNKRPMNIPKKERGRSNSLSLTSPAKGRAGQVRIVGGQWRRTPLAVRGLDGLRPTPERVRETVCDWLGHLFGTFDGRSALDLFAGSGALGLEMASRGFAKVDLVERDRAQAAGIAAVVSKLGATDFVTVTQGDAFGFLDRTTCAYDLVLLDPPFALGLQDRAIRAVLPRLAPDGVIYVERSEGRTADTLLAEMGLVRVRTGTAGQVSYELLVRRSSPLAALVREERLTRREERVEAARLRRLAKIESSEKEGEE